MSVSVQSYRFLEHAFSQISHARTIVDAIKWDCINFAKSAAYSFDDIFSVEEIKYDMLVNPALSSAIEDAMSKIDLLNAEQRQNLQCMVVLSKCYSAIPIDLYKAFIRAKAKTFFAGVMAKKDSQEFDPVPLAFSSFLQRLRDVATCISEVEGVNKYDALLGMFEREVRSSDIESILSKLGPMVRKALQNSSNGSSQVASRPLVISKQKKILEGCSEKIGFKKNELLMLEGNYELCDWVRDGDYRVFIDYREDSLRSAITSLLRITAKAVYKAAIPPGWVRQPVYWTNFSMLQSVVSMISEHMVASNEFDAFIKSQVKGVGFGLSRIPKGSLMRLFSNRENEGKVNILTEISELATSSIRYSLEKELLDGKLEPDAIQDAWREGLKYYFGFDIDAPEAECYDESWSAGEFCTVPLKMYSSVAGWQLFSSLRDQNQGALAEVGEGSFKSIFRWVCENVCFRSISMNGRDVITDVSGSGIDADAYAAMLGLR